MKMIEEKQIIRKHSRLIWVSICIYFLIVAGFYLGKSVGERQGLEYRFWVDACFRIWVWFVPILFAGIMILRICIKQWKRKSPWRWILSVLLLVYGCGAVYVSFIYVLVNAFTITSDEKMPDGNLVVAEPYGMESIHHYAEPVAIFFRRDFSFDEVRTADSLSKIYGVPFQAVREEHGQWFYASEAYPEIEVTNILYGYTETSYLDNNFRLALTSKQLEKHQDIFDFYGIELVSYVYGQAENDQEGQRAYTAVLVSEENKQKAAEAIAAFIEATLEEDRRPDGKSCWAGVDGSIILVAATETGSYKSIRNIPFSLEPEYSWIYDADVTSVEIAENIVIKKETDNKSEAEGAESIANESDIPEFTEDHTGTEQVNQGEITQEVLAHYLSIEPACSFVTEEGMEYRMIPVDRALGSSFYVLIGTDDQWKSISFINRDPYNGSGGESRWITFLDQNVGVSCLAHAAGSYGSLYRTEDGGISWEEIDYPSAKAKLSDGSYYNPFVMPEKIYEENGLLFMEVGQGADGDYYDSELGFCHGLYQSADRGINWEFVKNIPKER